MADVVVTVPQRLWPDWIAEGDAAGDDATGAVYAFWLGFHRPTIDPGERVYVVAHGKLRGWAPLVRIETAGAPAWGYGLVREGNAVACTIAQPIPGFRGFRYRWWRYEDETPFEDWRIP